jgi:hypothetical protein
LRWRWRGTGLDDAVADTKPWTATSYYKRDPDGHVIEYNCDLVVDYRQPR